MSAQPINPDVPPNHCRIEIDGQPLLAPKGSMIIHAADKAGIAIPRFCYHEKLPIAANCRMCLVEVEKMPKPAPACATPVMDGMKVFTRSDKAARAQQGVMEFLLINHPLDCPICDQGGECELQDTSLSYGRSASRFQERKRVVPDEDLGPLVATEMTRCIQCTRCVRFTAEIAGTHELGGMYRGEQLQIGTYDGKPLMSELSGNVIDVCPVGALTNKVYRFRARPWEMVARASVGYHDALGSNLFLHVRRGEVMRAVPRDNEAVNECWLSDRDRYSHQGLDAADRARVPLLRDGDVWREAGWDEALARATAILGEHRGDALGVLAHPASSNEEAELLVRLAAALGTPHLDHRIHALDLSDGAVAEPFAMPVAELEQADAIVVLGSDLREEVPLLAARLRKAARRGAAIHVINPLDADFAMPLASRRIVAPSALATELDAPALREALAGREHVALILGALAEQSLHAAAIRAAASRFSAATGARLCRIPQGANAVGLARAGLLPSGLDARAMLAAPRRAYLLHGIEPGLDFADPSLATRAFAGARVVALTAFACASTRAVAEVILPIALLPEMDASLSNLDGITQCTQAAGTLPGEARPGWRVLRALADQLALPGFAFADLDGLRTDMPQRTLAAAASPAPLAGEGTLEALVKPAPYRADAVLRRAAALQAHPLNRSAALSLHPDDAAHLGVANGAMLRVRAAAGTAHLPARLDAGLPMGVVMIEDGHAATAPIIAGRVTVELA